MARRDPLGNFRFRLEIDGVAAAGFSEVTIGAASVEVIDYREGNEPAHVRKLPGLRKWGSVVLKRGVTNSMDLYDWFKQVVQGQVAAARRDIIVVVLDDAGADQARFVVSEAWPAKYETGHLNAKGNEVLIETLELVNEGIERVS
ncbi:MAG TPA: phage tail protein [Vineibacter sp.]|nr:phage tail protein [Vineibacter sp.]